MNLDQWKELLNDVKPGNGSTEGNLLEQIKKKLEKQDYVTYEEWEKENFHEDHMFTVPLTVGNRQEDTLITLLYLAAEAGNIELIGYLIEEKHVDPQSRLFYTPHSTVQHRIHQVNRLIEIEKHVDPNLENNSKEQQFFLSKLTDILIHSIKSERFEIVEYILGRVSKISCSATREIYARALIDGEIAKELDRKIEKQKEERNKCYSERESKEKHAKYERWIKLKEHLVKNNELLTQDMHSNDRNNINFKEEVQVVILEGEPTNRTQPSKEEDLNLDYNSLGNTTQLSAQDDSGKTYPESILVTKSNDSNGKHKETITPSMENEEQHADISLSSSNKAEDQKVAPPDIESDEDKFLGAQDSNNKEDTRKSEVFESEARYVEKIKELSQELNRKATQVDTLTREVEDKSRKLSSSEKLKSEILKVFVERISAKEKEINKLKGQVAQLEGIKAQFAEKEKEAKQLNKLRKCLGEKTSKLTRLTRELEKERDLAVAQKLKQEESFKQAQQEVNNLKGKLAREQKLRSDTVNQSRRYEAQLAEKEKALIDSRKSAQELEQVIENLNGQIVKLGEERDLILAQKLEKEDELQWTKAQLERKEGELNRAQRDFATLQKSFEREVQENDDLTRKNNQLTEDKGLLSSQEGENIKFPAANAQNRKQSKYTSFPFFIVAGTFAVVASLETRYLAVWAALALPALVFFALGCHCLYKENTALSDVKVDQPDNQRLLGSSL